MNILPNDLPTKVSVIIPAYNAENCITEAIDSILNQHYKSLEIIVVNDCSRDETLEVLKRYTDKLTILTNKTNMGASYSRNQGIKIASGEYIAFLDADDIWYPNKLSRQIQIMKMYSDCSFSYGKDVRVKFDEYNSNVLIDTDNSLTLHTKKEFVEIFENPYFSTSTIMISRQHCLNNGGFREDIKTAEDIDFCYKSTSNTLTIALDFPLSVTRRISDSLGASATSYSDNLFVIDDFLNKNPSFANHQERIISNIKRRIYDSWVSDLIYQRKINKAITILFKSMHVKPSPLSIKLLIKALLLWIKQR